MFQACFGLKARVLPWRRPECITGAGSLQRLPELLADAGCKEPMIVASRRQCAAPEFITMAERLPARSSFHGVTAETGLDALTHAVEAYIGRFYNTRETRSLAWQVVEAIYRMNRALGIPEYFSCIRSEDLPQMAAILGHGLILGLQLEVGVLLHLQRNIRQLAEAIAGGIGDAAGVALIALAAGIGAVAPAIGTALGEGDRAGFRQIGRNAGLTSYQSFRTIFISTVNIVLVV